MKYRSYSTDFGSLERELRGDTYDPISAESAEEVEAEPEAETDDQYADLASRYADFDAQDDRKIS